MELSAFKGRLTDDLLCQESSQMICFDRRPISTLLSNDNGCRWDFHFDRRAQQNICSDRRA